MAVSAMVWSFILPFHSVSLVVSGDDGPLARATVTVDGEKTTRRPSRDDGKLRITSLNASAYTITVSREGYIARKFGITVSDVLGFTSQQPITLERARGTVRITSRPAGASIAVDRKQLGSTTPQIISITAGAHEILVARDGCHSVTTPDVYVENRQTAVSGLSTLTCEEPRPGKVYPVQIEASERNVEILARGQSYGEAPVVLKLPAGSFLVSARLGGRQKQELLRVPEMHLLTFDFHP